MHSEPTSNADVPTDDAIIAGRFDWVTTVTREQLADLASRSRTLAGSARTRVTPLTDLPSRRFRPTGVEPAQHVTAEPDASSKPWMLLAVVAALVSVIIVVAARRSRQQGDEEADIDVVMDDGSDEMIYSNP